MKIEKLNENKIRIFLNLEDLEKKNIDFHSFMSNSIESQTLFLDVLDEAEKEIGFVTKDYKIAIEALATSEGNFILTVTRDIEDDKKHRKIHIKRKSSDINKPVGVYLFKSFDDLCSFCEFISTSPLNSFINSVNKISLYTYENEYYLVFSNIHSDLKLLKGFCTSITEFASFVNNSDLFEKKLLEYGTVIIKKNAINVILKNFCKK